MYDLEKTIDRAALDALKAVPFNPSQEGCIPLWVADMDFGGAGDPGGACRPHEQAELWIYLV